MRFLRSLLCLSLAFVLLCVPFSASALESGDAESGLISDGVYVDYPDVGLLPGTELDQQYPIYVNPFSMTEDDTSMVDSGKLYMLSYFYAGESTSNITGKASLGEIYTSGFTKTAYTSDAIYDYYRDYFVVHANGEKIYSNNTEFAFTIDGLVNSIYTTVSYKSGSTTTYRQKYSFFNPSSVYKFGVTLQDKDGVSHEVIPQYYTFSQTENVSSTSTFFGDTATDKVTNLVVELPAVDFDVYRISVYYEYVGDVSVGYSHKTGWTIHDDTVDRYLGFYRAVYDVELTELSEYGGLLGSIIAWLQSIRDGIVGMWDSIKEIPAALVELPSKIWEFISNGLQSLFIPDEQTMIDIKDDWDTLLADRFGAVYEAGTLISEWAGNFTVQAEKSTVEMPEVTLNLAGADFSFGGYEVDLIPDGFVFLVSILKGLLDIVCTLLFVNAMKKRFTAVIGGGSE